MNDFKYSNKEEVISAARLFIREKIVESGEQGFTSPEIAADFLKLHHPVNNESEVFSVIFLNSKHQLIEFKELFSGSINSAAVYPRVVAQQALKLNAAAVILCHNHPSGDTEPSRADRDLTARLVETLQLVETKVLDHFIVGGDNVCSMSSLGMV